MHVALQAHVWRRVALSAIALLILLLVAVVLPRAGRFLVADEPSPAGDVAVVLSGEPVSRVLGARDLYRKGRVRRVLIVPEPPPDVAVQRELTILGLLDPQLPPISERILVASGVPKSDIAFLGEPADGTAAEARRVRRSLAGRPDRRIVVVTSKFASRRACYVFRRVLRDREVVCAPTPYDPFDPAGWWSRPRDALYVLMEYQKFLATTVMLILEPGRD